MWAREGSSLYPSGSPLPGRRRWPHSLRTRRPPRCRWDPPDGDIVVSCKDARAGLDSCHREPLARAEGIASHPLDGGGGVDENRVLVPALLSLLKGAEGLVDGEGLYVEDLLVGAQAVAASGPPPRGVPDTSCPHPAAVLSRAVGPSSVPASPFAGGLESCWWFNTDKRQSREHLFKGYEEWTGGPERCGRGLAESQGKIDMKCIGGKRKGSVSIGTCLGMRSLRRFPRFLKEIKTGFVLKED